MSSRRSRPRWSGGAPPSRSSATSPASPSTSPRPATGPGTRVRRSGSWTGPGGSPRTVSPATWRSARTRRPPRPDAGARPGGGGGAAGAAARRDRPETATLLPALAALHVRGTPVDFTALTGRRRRVELPTYAFQRESYWPVARRETEAEGLRYRVGWRPLPVADGGSLPGWLVTGAED